MVQLEQLVITQFFTMTRFQFAVIATECESFAQISLHAAVARIVDDDQCLGGRCDEMIQRLANRLTEAPGIGVPGRNSTA